MGRGPPAIRPRGAGVGSRSSTRNGPRPGFARRGKSAPERPPPLARAPRQRKPRQRNPRQQHRPQRRAPARVHQSPGCGRQMLPASTRRRTPRAPPPDLASHRARCPPREGRVPAHGRRRKRPPASVRNRPIRPPRPVTRQAVTRQAVTRQAVTRPRRRALQTGRAMADRARRRRASRRFRVHRPRNPPRRRAPSRSG